MYTYKTKTLSKLNEELFDAIETNDIKKVKSLIKKGADVNARNFWGQSPIHFAVFEYVNASITEILIKNGANPNQRMARYHDTPLHVACWAYYDEEPRHRNAMDKILILIKNGANVKAKDSSGKTPLDIAIETGNLDAVALLCNNGAKCRKQKRDKKMKFSFFRKKYDGINTLDSCGWAPIHYAVAHGYFDYVKLLIKEGANVQILSGSWKTPLSLAKQYGYEDIAQLLIEAGRI